MEKEMKEVEKKVEVPKPKKLVMKTNVIHDGVHYKKGAQVPKELEALFVKKLYCVEG